jgi:hypothetical protein
MGLFDTATNAASTPIVPQDRFIFECAAIGEQPPYAPPGESPKPGARPGIKWEMKLFFASTGEPFYFQDEQYVFFQSTTANMQRGARAREYAEALLGRELSEGEEINPSDLIGKRALGMVIHEISRNDKTKKVAKLVAPEPLKEAAPSRRGAASVTPSASSADIDAQLAASDALRERAKKLIRNAELDETPGYETWSAVDLANLADADVEALVKEVREAMLAAV